ncbi:PepSY domain-containing protein [Flavitalea flava]
MAKKLTLRQRSRSAILWAHRWLGIVSGLIMLIVALTGCIYVFEQELRDTFQSKYYYH